MSHSEAHPSGHAAPATHSKWSRWKRPLTLLFFLALIVLLTMFATRIEWAEVLQTLASYRHGMVRFDPQALRNLRVSGVFKLDDTAAALAALADNLPIQVEYFTDLLVVVKPR